MNAYYPSYEITYFTYGKGIFIIFHSFIHIANLNAFLFGYTI